MRNKLTFAFGLLSIVFASAQIYTPNTTIQGNSGNDYLGIGRAPSYRLDISGSHQDSQILLHSIGGGDEARQADLMLWASEPDVSYTGVGIGNNVKVSHVKQVHLLNPIRGGSYLRLLDNGMSFNIISSLGINKQVLSVNENANVGIGTAYSLAKLEVNNGNILVRNSANVDNASSIMIAHSINEGNLDTYGTSIRTIIQNAGSNTYGLQFFTQETHFTNQTEKLRILGNGNVGIGITNPSNKLDVNGTIHSKEVKVDMNGWSDFVFKKEYNLPTLEQVEKHIAEKGHLENIPSEKEVLENGIKLGEMNAKLLQKIEEMTLYMIDQNKRMNKLEMENKDLQNKLESIIK